MSRIMQPLWENFQDTTKCSSDGQLVFLAGAQAAIALLTSQIQKRNRHEIMALLLEMNREIASDMREYSYRNVLNADIKH